MECLCFQHISAVYFFFSSIILLLIMTIEPQQDTVFLLITVYLLSLSVMIKPPDC